MRLSLPNPCSQPSEYLVSSVSDVLSLLRRLKSFWQYRGHKSARETGKPRMFCLHLPSFCCDRRRSSCKIRVQETSSCHFVAKRCTRHSWRLLHPLTVLDMRRCISFDVPMGNSSVTACSFSSFAGSRTPSLALTSTFSRVSKYSGLQQ